MNPLTLYRYVRLSAKGLLASGLIEWRGVATRAVKSQYKIISGGTDWFSATKIMFTLGQHLKGFQWSLLVYAADDDDDDEVQQHITVILD